jgi:integrase
MDGGKRWALNPSKLITDEQIKAILEAAADTPWAWLTIFLLANLGLRISEVLHLRVSDFDRGSGSVRVTRRKKRVLQSEVLMVAEAVFDVLDGYVKQAQLSNDAWLFPGACGPCKRQVAVVVKREGVKTKTLLWGHAL